MWVITHTDSVFLVMLVTSYPFPSHFEPRSFCAHFSHFVLRCKMTKYNVGLNDVQVVLKRQFHIWVDSWDYGTYRPSSNTHAQQSVGATRLTFGRTLCLLPYIMCANSEAFAVRLCDKYHNLRSWLIWFCYVCEGWGQTYCIPRPLQM